MAAVNRERIVLAYKFQGQLEDLTVDEIFVAEEVNGSRLGLPTGGQYNLDDLAASMIDGAILPLRQSYERHPGTGKKPETGQIKGATILGQLHHVLLSLWEDCSWRGYRAVREGDEVTVSPNDEGEARICAESLSRYYARISETFIHGINAWRKLPSDVKARIYANGVQVGVEGFGRKMKFTPRSYRPTTTEPPRSILLRICGSELYFEAILKIPLPKCHGLNLDQLLRIWEVLYALVDTLSKSLPEDTGPQTINELDKFAPLIPSLVSRICVDKAVREGPQDYDRERV